MESLFLSLCHPSLLALPTIHPPHLQATMALPSVTIELLAFSSILYGWGSQYIFISVRLLSLDIIIFGVIHIVGHFISLSLLLLSSVITSTTRSHYNIMGQQCSLLYLVWDPLYVISSFISLFLKNSKELLLFQLITPQTKICEIHSYQLMW